MSQKVSMPPWYLTVSSDMDLLHHLRPCSVLFCHLPDMWPSVFWRKQWFGYKVQHLRPCDCHTTGCSLSSDYSTICMSSTSNSACQITSASFCLSLSSHLPVILPLPQCSSRLPPRSIISRHLSRFHCPMPVALLPSVFRQRTAAAHSFQWIYAKRFWLQGHICMHLRHVMH